MTAAPALRRVFLLLVILALTVLGWLLLLDKQKDRSRLSKQETVNRNVNLREETNLSTLTAVRERPRAVIFLSAPWSIYAVRGRREFIQAADVSAGEKDLAEVSVFILDEDAKDS